MKNILKNTPLEKARCRCLHITKFVDQEDLNNKNVLDIGSGFGWFEIFSLDNAVNKIVGMDMSVDNVNIAKKSVLNKKVTFIVGDALNFEHAGDSYDTVAAWDIIEHLPGRNEDKLFSEVGKVLKTGGVFYISTPNNWIVCNILDPAWLFGHTHYNIEYLEQVANNNGFSLEKKDISGGLWFSFWILNLYFSKWILRRNPIFEDFFVEKVNKEFQLGKGKAQLFLKFRKK